MPKTTKPQSDSLLRTLAVSDHTGEALVALADVSESEKKHPRFGEIEDLSSDADGFLGEFLGVDASLEFDLSVASWSGEWDHLLFSFQAGDRGYFVQELDPEIVKELKPESVLRLVGSWTPFDDEDAKHRALLASLRYLGGCFGSHWRVVVSTIMEKLQLTDLDPGGPAADRLAGLGFEEEKIYRLKEALSDPEEFGVDLACDERWDVAPLVWALYLSHEGGK